MGLLRSLALPNSHLVRTRHSVHTHAVSREGLYFWLHQRCRHPASPKAPWWIPRPSGKGVCTPLMIPLHPQQKGPAAQGTGFLCPGQTLLTRTWRNIEKRESSRLCGHTGTVWSPGSLRGPALNLSELQSLCVGTLGSAKSSFTRPCEDTMRVVFGKPSVLCLHKHSINANFSSRLSKVTSIFVAPLCGELVTVWWQAWN